DPPAGRRLDGTAFGRTSEAVYPVRTASLGLPVVDVGQLGAGAAAQQWPLVRLDGPQLGLVHGLPVVLQDSTCVTGVRVPGPVPVADSVSLQVSDKGPLPGAFDVSDDRAH